MSPAASLTLVVSDVLKWNYPLTRRQQGTLAIALRDAACGRVETTDDEREWFAAFLDSDLRVTAYFDENALSTADSGGLQSLPESVAAVLPVQEKPHGG